MRILTAKSLPSGSSPLDSFEDLAASPARAHRIGSRSTRLMTEWVALLSVLEWILPALPERYSLGHHAGYVAALGSTLLSWLVWHLLQVRNERDQARVSLREANERTQLLRALLDTGTDLPNRAGVETKIQRAIEGGVRISCLSIDLGGLHQEASDRTAAAVSKKLQPVLGRTDVLGRIRAGRFAVLTRSLTERDELTAFADRIAAALSEPLLVDGCAVRFSPRLGIACAPCDASTGELLLSASKNAMMLAVNSGGKPYRFAIDLPATNSNRAQRLAGKLEIAIEQRLLRLVYQPIFDAQDRMVAVEALSRWHDAEEGHISPGEFIEVAEHTGLIVPLSRWVLEETCRQMVEWQTVSCSLERVAVNVSARYAGQSDFPATVQGVLFAAGLAPSKLELELTESALASDFDKVQLNLQALSETGVRISIDDFGTGYSSLSRVRDLRADVLKIDRSFVQAAGDQLSRAAVVRAIVEMAHTLNLSVIAEGVETTEQLKMLRGMACDEVQGFLLGRPQGAEEITNRLRTGATLAQRCAERELRLVPRLA